MLPDAVLAPNPKVRVCQLGRQSHSTRSTGLWNGGVFMLGDVRPQMSSSRIHVGPSRKVLK